MLNTDEVLRVSVLPLPKRTKPDKGSFDISPAHLRRWIAALPSDDLSRAARGLYELLVELSTLEIDPTERFRVLEDLRDPVREVSQRLARSYAGANFPLPAQRYRAASLNRRFQDLMATGYKQVTEDVLAHRERAHRRLFGASLHCTALHRALRYMGRLLLTCYEIYAPYPENSWRDIHHLYGLSVRLDCQGQPIADSHCALVPEANLEEAYKQILLFALASPYRLRPGESAQVYAALEVWSASCRLGSLGGEARPARGLFAVEPDSDHQPRHLDLPPKHQGEPDLILDTTTLGGLLRHRLHQMKYGQAEDEGAALVVPGMTADLLRRLMRSWGMLIERRFKRERGPSHAEVVLGLAAVHRVLSKAARPGSPAPVDVVATALPDEATLGQPAPADSQICVIRDESRGGARLQWHGSDQIQVALGSLIAVRRADRQRTPSEWRIGTVRWMQYKRSDLLQFGVQLLAVEAEAVTIQPCPARGICARPVNGLRLSASEALGLSPMLLGPDFLEYFEGPEVVVIGAEDKQRCRLSTLVESTGSFARFEYEEIGGRESLADEESLEGDTDFTRIWDDL